ncbi:MAG: SDR family NAD(P)-dependent oxidoreductase [Deltaproteobacteria bacterium]|nr:SDR family NAD(P)-dependent oxidoreductase [Deltaproteobacteria bacterium]
MENPTKIKLAVALGAAALARHLVRRSRTIDLRDKVVLVTGGSRGLGLVLARQLVERGAKVAICARDHQELGRARLDLVARGGHVLAIPCDVTDRDDMLGMVTQIHDDLGPIDVLVNNASVIQVGPVDSMTLEDYERAMATHYWAPLYAILAVVPEMRRSRAGRIVNIASIGGKIAMPHLLPYSASKFALVGLSAGLRAELAQDGIVVTTVCPGLMRTGSPTNAMFKGDHAKEYNWFSVSDSLPLTSMNAERAARQILDACCRGDAEVVLSIQARVAVKLYALFPSLSQNVLGMVDRLLPKGVSKQSMRGRDVGSPLAKSILTMLTEQAARRNNEV